MLSVAVRKYICSVKIRAAEPESWGAGFLTTLGVGVGFFCPTTTPDVQWDHYLHHTRKLGIPVEMVQFLLKLLLKQRFLAVHHDFHWFQQQPNFIPFVLRSRSRKFCKVEVGSRIFYLRLRNPGKKSTFSLKLLIFSVILRRLPIGYIAIAFRLTFAET